MKGIYHIFSSPLDSLSAVSLEVVGMSAASIDDSASISAPSVSTFKVSLPIITRLFNFGFLM